MRPQLQLYRYAMESMYGDCHRTCIAMILDLDRDEVPHFMDGVPDNCPVEDPRSIAAEQAERDWLATRGLTIINVPLEGHEPLERVLECLTAWVKDAAVILGGRTARGGCHSVVFYKGRVYDPLTGDYCSLVGPQPSGYWYVTIYAGTTNPLPPAPEPGSVVTQEQD